MKKIIYLGIGIICFYATHKLCHKATDGFAIVNIYAPKHKPIKNWTLSISEEKKAELHTLFDQTFSYLNCGAQCYVFESEDKKYVIKFFKYHHMRVLPWLELVPLPSLLEQWKKRKILKKNRELTANFDSYALAMQNLPEETGLLYIHLNKTNFWGKKLRIKDKLGIFHQIDLDSTDFLVQKKGSLAYSCLEEWMKGRDTANLTEGLKGLFALIEKRCRAGLADKDPDFQTNFGFIEGKVPFQLDIGRFSLDPSKKDASAVKEELYRITRPFRSWIEKDYPLYLDLFDAILKERAEDAGL